MSRFNIKLIHPHQNITLEMIEGLPLTKGTWRRLVEHSNSALRVEHGTWENWVLGSPGGRQNIRLYDDNDTKSAIINDYIAGRTEGHGTFIIDDFAGQFSGDPFQWFS